MEGVRVTKICGLDVARGAGLLGTSLPGEPVRRRAGYALDCTLQAIRSVSERGASSMLSTFEAVRRRAGYALECTLHGASDWRHFTLVNGCFKVLQKSQKVQRARLLLGANAWSTTLFGIGRSVGFYVLFWGLKPRWTSKRLSNAEMPAMFTTHFVLFPPKAHGVPGQGYERRSGAWILDFNPNVPRSESRWHRGTPSSRALSQPRMRVGSGSLIPDERANWKAVFRRPWDKTRLKSSRSARYQCRGRY